MEGRGHLLVAEQVPHPCWSAGASTLSTPGRAAPALSCAAFPIRPSSTAGRPCQTLHRTKGCHFTGVISCNRAASLRLQVRTAPSCNEALLLEGLLHLHANAAQHKGSRQPDASVVVQSRTSSTERKYSGSSAPAEKKSWVLKRLGSAGRRVPGFAAPFPSRLMPCTTGLSPHLR